MTGGADVEAAGSFLMEVQSTRGAWGGRMAVGAGLEVEGRGAVDSAGPGGAEEGAGRGGRAAGVGPLKCW